MKFTLLAFAFLTWRGSRASGVPRSVYETQNIFNRGVQTFDVDSSESSQETPTTTKPLPPSYTVVDWKRFYPFGNKFPDSNHTDNVTTTTTDAPTKSGNEVLYPVYIKVPIRVPLKALYRKPEVMPKIVMPRTIRGTNTVAYPYRYKVPPRYMMVRQLPMRRNFLAYYKVPPLMYRRPRKYLEPVYQKTGIHDLYKKDVYYPLRGHGYEVTEPRPTWYDPGKLNNFI